MATELMNGLVIGPESELQSTPVVHYGEASRAAASFNTAMQRTASNDPFSIVLVHFTSHFVVTIGVEAAAELSSFGASARPLTRKPRKPTVS